MLTLAECGWLPIETAPRDGTKILVCRERTAGYEAWWKLGTWRWADGRMLELENDMLDGPTHWMKIWNPIETAPRNGTEILMRFVGRRPYITGVKWHSGCFVQLSDYSPVASLEATGWMELPPYDDAPALPEGFTDIKDFIAEFNKELMKDGIRYRARRQRDFELSGTSYKDSYFNSYDEACDYMAERGENDGTT